MSTADALPLSAAQFHILLAISAEPKHGYSIMLEVQETTAGIVRLGSGSLYRIIKQLLSDEWIKELPSDGGDERRRTYALTALGRRIAIAEAQRMDAVVRIARGRLSIPAT